MVPVYLYRHHIYGVMMGTMLSLAASYTAIRARILSYADEPTIIACMLMNKLYANECMCMLLCVDEPAIRMLLLTMILKMPMMIC